MIFSRRAALHAGCLGCLALCGVLFPALRGDAQEGAQEAAFDAVPSPALENLLVSGQNNHPPALPTPHATLPAAEGGKETPATTEGESPAWFKNIQQEYEAEGGVTPDSASGGGMGSEGRNAAAGRSPWLDTLKMLFGLCLVSGLIIGGGHLLRRYGKRSPLLAGAQYGEVLGRVHLDPRVSLYFVRSGGRVLVIGVAPQHIAMMTEFDEASFDLAALSGETQGTVQSADKANKRGRFLDELRARTQSAPKTEKPVSEAEDLEALRGDVQRLQRILNENMREP